MKTEIFPFLAIAIFFTLFTSCASFGPGSAGRTLTQASVPHAEDIGRGRLQLQGAAGPGVVYHNNDENFFGNVHLEYSWIPARQAQRRGFTKSDFVASWLLAPQFDVGFGEYAIQSNRYNAYRGRYGYTHIGFGLYTGAFFRFSNQNTLLLAVGYGQGSDRGEFVNVADAIDRVGQIGESLNVRRADPFVVAEAGYQVSYRHFINDTRHLTFGVAFKQVAANLTSGEVFEYRIGMGNRRLEFFGQFNNYINWNSPVGRRLNTGQFGLSVRLGK